MNPLVRLQQFIGPKLYKIVLVLAVIALATLPLSLGVFQGIHYIAVIAIASIVIWRAGDHFSPAADFIEEHHNLPQSVKAAVIDAIASSFPEFAVAVIAVLVLGKFEVGVATIAGSALYNVLVIPAAAGLVATTPLIVSREVVWRDSLFYLVTVVVLIVTILLYSEWSIGIAAMFILIYVAYVMLLHQHYKSHQENTANQDSAQKEEDEEKDTISIGSETAAWAWIVSMMLLMGGASYILVEASIELGDLLGIDAVIMAFVVIAAGTSAPDTALSILSAQKGNYDAAVSNVFGSNIFDICICLGFPIGLMYFLGHDFTSMELEQKSLLWILLGATVLSITFFYTNKYTLTKPKSWIMMLVYVASVLYAITLAYLPDGLS